MVDTEKTGNALDGTAFYAVSEVGRGGMGTVLLAEHRMLKKRVAVKLLNIELSGEENLIDRLRVEAEILANLSSPHVVDVIDCGVTAAGEPYIAMELLRGRSLQVELKARRFFPVEEAIELVRQATRGVMAAHALGIIHRDLKPANLFYCVPDPPDPPYIKVLDFGVAKILSGPIGPPKVATAAGMMVGSPKTMSPEACLSEPVDGRSDVYSLGIVLYMLLVGRAPFDARKDFLDYARAHVSEVPLRPSTVAKQPIPAAVDAVVLRALEKNPSQRFQTAADFEKALAHALDPEGFVDETTRKVAPNTLAHPVAAPAFAASPAVVVTPGAVLPAAVPSERGEPQRRGATVRFPANLQIGVVVVVMVGLVGIAYYLGRATTPRAPVPNRAVATAAWTEPPPSMSTLSGAPAQTSTAESALASSAAVTASGAPLKRTVVPAQPPGSKPAQPRNEPIFDFPEPRKR